MRIAPTHKAFDAYETTLADYRDRKVSNEGAVRFAFQTLLTTLAPARWNVLGEQTLANGIRPDGVMKDGYNLTRGYWEAKDTADDLDEEIRKKIAKGYPLTNIIFEDTRRAVLYQHKQQAMDVPLTDRKRLADLLAQFFTYEEPDIVAFERAVDEFKGQIPDLAEGLKQTIHHEREQTNRRFIAAFTDFAQTCRTSIDPNIADAALEEMLVQHLLTERLFRTIFNNPDFTKRNVIAAEIEKVIDALTSHSFSRADFLASLNRYYVPIEEAAKGITDWSEKQTFLNTVYERFFQGFSTRQADTHGVVYTPQAIVDFMVSSVEEVLRSEFGTTLAAPVVAILDPATGTGNFIVNIMRRITDPTALKQKYTSALFANEIMLLPYYIACMNIEHEYYTRTEAYEPFEGLCFADTLDMAQSPQLGLFSEQNTARVQREKDTPITVIIGNPPYNVGQKNENDNNKKRRYSQVDDKIQGTYVKDSKASLHTKLYDMYVKFFRWASDRLGERDGIVCFVSNNSFVDQYAFDGMRKHLLQDFTQVYHLDLHGNVRQNPKLSGTTHNVFGIQVGVGITIAIRNRMNPVRFLRYHRVPEMWRKTEKLAYLTSTGGIGGVGWQEMRPDARHTWLTEGMDPEYDLFLPLGTKDAKLTHTVEMETIFKTYSQGVLTARDRWVYGFRRDALIAKVRKLIEDYNGEVDRWKRRGSNTEAVDDFVQYDDKQIKWSGDLKVALERGHHATYKDVKIRRALYRPFCMQWLFFDRLLNNSVYQMPIIFPTPNTESENVAICVPGVGNRKGFSCFVANALPSFDLAFEKAQCFPFYTYNEDGSGRRENITEWALGQFRERYGAAVTKRDIFHYVYALLHHPEYRSRYAENLKRDLPRVPLAPDTEAFQAFVAAGAALANLHLGYETAEPYQLERLIAAGATAKSLFHVQKMKLSKDKSAVIVNPHLTLSGIPPEAFEYRLGNRSALEWVLDQYRISTDARSGITSDPNHYRPDDPEYIVRLVGQVVAVSVATVGIVAGLPPLTENSNPRPLLSEGRGDSIAVP